MLKSKEQFKNYVYEKADKKAVKIRKDRAILIRTATAFSLLFVVGGVFLNGYLQGNHPSENAANDAANEVVAENGLLADEYHVYSASLTADKAKSFSYSCEAGGTIFDDAEGVKQDGFVNITECNVANEEEALELAKKECTVDYDKTDISYDESEDVWKIEFSKTNVAGGSQTVYLSGKGITVLIVYGE